MKNRMTPWVTTPADTN